MTYRDLKRGDRFIFESESSGWNIGTTNNREEWKMFSIEAIREAYAATGLKPATGGYYRDGCACPEGAVIAHRFGVDAALTVQKLYDLEEIKELEELLKSYLQMEPGDYATFAGVYESPDEYVEDPAHIEIGKLAMLVSKEFPPVCDISLKEDDHER